MKRTTALVLFAGFGYVSASSQTSFVGCYNTHESMNLTAISVFTSAGFCNAECQESPVFAMTKGTDCYCGENLPPMKNKVQDDSCSQACSGYPDDICGDDLGKYFAVYSIGLDSPSNTTSNTTTSNTTWTTVTSTVACGCSSTATPANSSSSANASVTTASYGTFLPSSNPNSNGSFTTPAPSAESQSSDATLHRANIFGSAAGAAIGVAAVFVCGLL